MAHSKTILFIIGSASLNSANEKLVNIIIQLLNPLIQVEVFKDLKNLPHFEPEQSSDHPSEAIKEFRSRVERADGVIFSTPEYVFSIPAGLKNALEWCVATTIFSDKPVGVITASAQGQKGHEELQMIMQTLGAELKDETSLLVQGIKGKINSGGEVTDAKTKEELSDFVKAFSELLVSRTDRS
ncbi:NADPH-dependent FMN reductase [Desertivirga arenae]|uniref:NADPH-dependent FMN reductase n=1 Tax=Desertivirga arenae TaxID=2810309 RepID=UPI001A971389|nr:NADPH-dependent FMN reductase [Pedobacter sp. SYSU D00823]